MITLKDWSETAKNLAQIVALAVGGYWTYTVYVHKDAPSLQTHATTGGGFEWSTVDAESCMGTFYVNLKNDGQTDFNVDRVRLRLWEFENPKALGAIAFVDLNSIQSGRPLFERVYKEGIFVRHFPPNYGRNDSYSWIFKRKQDSNVIVSMEFFTNANSDSAEWLQYYSGRLCNVKNDAK
jgi:hypothetical protein